jgi:hypothetical protein
MSSLDFTRVGDQRSFEVIPDNTICTVQMTVRPGSVGDGGWLTRAKDGNSEHLNCEFVVVDGPHAKRKFWDRLTVTGTNHAEAIDIATRRLKAILLSARGVRPDDNSDAAKAALRLRNYGDFDGLRFVARLGTEPPKDGYAAKNTIKEVITPEKADWKKPEQIDRDLLGKATNTATPAQASAPPANAIARPQWAQPQPKPEQEKAANE